MFVATIMNDSSVNTSLSWALNFRVRVLLKAAVRPTFWKEKPLGSSDGFPDIMQFSLLNYLAELFWEFFFQKNVQSTLSKSSRRRRAISGYISQQCFQVDYT